LSVSAFKEKLNVEAFRRTAVFRTEKDTPASTKNFGSLGSFILALVAKKFEKMSKIKLLSTF